MMPGTSPDATIFLKAFLFISPFPCLNSARFIRHHMHQHTPQAPRSPNNSSRSRQREGVSDSHFRRALGNVLVAMNPLPLVRFTEDVPASVASHLRASFPE